MLSIVTPTLNAAPYLEAMWGGVAEGASCWPGGAEWIVSDGGSQDGSRGIAARLGAVVIEGPKGRGGQLRRGAAAAQGETLLFLHADTRLEAGWARAAAAFASAQAGHGETELKEAGASGTSFGAAGGAGPGAAAGSGPCRAAVFTLAFDDPSAYARRIERRVAWRVRVLALPYGDQGLLIGRGFYEALGGFADIPLMEDVDMVRRIGRRRLTVLPVKAVTSAAKYRRDGWRRRTWRNAGLLAAYYAGVSPHRLARWYD